MVSSALVLALSGCAAEKRIAPQRVFPPPPTYARDHRYKLDELIELAVHHNAGLDAARYEAEAVQGLVDRVKALWLPQMRFNFAAILYDNDFNYDANAFDLVSINVPITGTYNFISALSLAQIVSTGGKRTSGLKQAKMYAAIKRLEVLRLQDQVVADVANFYYLVGLTSDVDAVLEDALRRIRVFRQVSENLNRRGSLRGSRVDSLQADYFVSQLEQVRIAVQAGRYQAYLALRTFIGVAREEPLVLRSASLPAAVTLSGALSRSATAIKGFFARAELWQVNLFTKIREQQVEFAKAAWRPNILFLGVYDDVQGNKNTILGAVEGLVSTLVVDLPIYDPARRGRLREALGLEQASLAFQRQVEQLITLEIDVTTVDVQKTLATVLKTARARKVAGEHYAATRQSYSRELLPASAVVTAIALDMLAKLQHSQALYAYHHARARLKRVTADRDAPYGH